jgi:hypothetical protein
MSRSLQDLLNFADKFEKIAVDIPQPESFDNDFEKYLALLSRKHGPPTVREMPTVHEPDPETTVVVDDLPLEKTPELEAYLAGLEKGDDDEEGADDDDLKLGVSGHPFEVDEEDIKAERAKPKCADCHGIGYKDDKICKKCDGSGRGKEKKSEAAQALISFAKKTEKKLDPKAKVRNRGTVCVPASQAKDKKDHFPINSEAQARNALARVHQYKSVPSWYGGSLKSLQELVSRKVHSKYKGIGKSEKKSSAEHLMVKYASVEEMTRLLQSN